MTETCCICLGPFNEPRGLPCLHCFCTKCLQGYIDYSVTVIPADIGFQCPICRRMTIPDDISEPVCMWGQGFPLAHRLIESVKCAKQYQKVISSNPKYCDCCSQQNNVQVDAFAFCRGCMVDLCPCCYNEHAQDHNIMVSIKLFCNVQLMSTEHYRGTPDLLCRKCLVFTYTGCIKIQHSTCETDGEVVSVASFVEDLKREKMIYIEKLEALLNDSENFLGELSRAGQEIRSYEAEARHSEEVDEIKMHLKTLDDKMCEVQRLFNRILNELERQMLHQNTENVFEYIKEHFNSNENPDDQFQETNLNKLISGMSLSSFKAKLIATIEEYRRGRIPL